MALARNYITEPTEVMITNAMPVGPELLVAVYREDHQTREDIYNCSDESARKQILEATPGAPLKCVVTPDTTEDIDQHPSIAVLPVA